MTDMAPETVVTDEVNEEGDTTVIVATETADNDDAVEAVVVEEVIEQASDIATLTAAVAVLASQVEELSSRVNVAEVQSEIALEVADDAVEAVVAEAEAVEAVVDSVEVTNENVEEIAEEEDVEIDTPPNPRVPWTHRSFRNLFNKD